MARPQKNSHPFSIRMDIETYKRLNYYCESSGQSKTLAIERAINMYIDDYESKMRHIENLTKKKDG